MCVLDFSCIALLEFHCKTWMYSSSTYAFLALLECVEFVGIKLNRGMKKVP